MSKSQDSTRVYYPSQFPRGISPAQRFRIEAYEKDLGENNVLITMRPFLSEKTAAIFYKNGHALAKVTGIFMGFVRRFADLFTLHKYNRIFINREASPVGPPFFEWIYARVLGKKIIYDFDDAIWQVVASDANKIARYVKSTWKIKYIIKWSHIVIAGNKYLCDFALQYNSNTVIIPTAVDTERYSLRANQDSELVTIGWTGSFSTLVYLQLIIPLLQELQQKIPFKLIIIADRKPDFEMIDMEYYPWSEANEVVVLSRCQIGLMPMLKDEWSLGKCGFKIIQYMALGIVPVADDWGANKAIIEHGKNGFLIGEDPREWITLLTTLIKDKTSRKIMGEKAIQTARQRFSTQANLPKLLKAFLF